MKDKFKGILFAFLPFIVIMIISSFAGYSSEPNYDELLDESHIFTISNYLVEIEATDTRLANIKETIDVDFYIARASIIRDIPVSAGVEIRDINVEGRVFSVTKYQKFISVDLQADNFTPSLASRRYIITYTLDYSKAFKHISVSKDSIPLNAIGQGWPVEIQNAEIRITYPASPVKSYYYVGKRGSTTGESRLNIVTGANSETITTVGKLMPFEGVTIGYDMPDGTLKSVFDGSLIFKLLIALILIGAFYFIFSIFGKDEQITPVINFEPPKGMNPAEAGYLIDSNCSPNDMTSLIFYWASQGHITINEIGEGKDIELVKVRELEDDHKSYEHLMFSGLFKYKMNKVKISSLKDSYYTVLTSAQGKVKGDHVGKLYSSKASMLSILSLALVVLITGLWTNIASRSVSIVYGNGAGYFSLIIGAILYFVGVGMLKYEPKLIKPKSQYYMYYFVAVMFASLILFFILRNSFVPFYDIFPIIAMFTLSMCIVPFINKRTEGYHEQLNQLVGFRDFLLHAEKSRLETLLQENPQYYYDILPYANVLGVSDIWMKKFNGLTIAPPTYYYSTRPFSLFYFNMAFRRSMNNISTTMVSRPAQSGSGGGGFGGGGGGGFSGGGFGGGGGRSR